jgi:aminoglycoside phosphotransferase (APT) family kinase protein
MVMSQMGGQNCHVDIKFDDGVVWIARFRLDNDPTLPPRATQEKIFASEVATLRFLSNTTVPVPAVFYASFEDKGIGSPVVLMQKLAGKALQWYNASVQQKTKIMEQLANIFIELQRHPFSSSGSLISGGEQVGPFAQVPMFSTPAQSLGPFSTVEAHSSPSRHSSWR